MRIASTPASPPPQIVQSLRTVLQRADERVSQFGVALRGVLPAGPFEPGSATAHRVEAAALAAHLAASESSYATFLLEQLRDEVTVPSALDEAMRGVGQLARTLSGHAGYFDALSDLGAVPRNQEDIARGRLDAFGGHVKLGRALIELNRTGW
jgi:hypothetical protein